MATGFGMSAEVQAVQAKARELAAAFAERASEHDRDRSAPVEHYARLREAGFYGLVIPKEFGGMGLSIQAWLAVAEELAQGCASTALAFNMHINATGAIMEHPMIPEAMKRRTAELVLREGKLMCTSVSEPATSSLLGPSYVPAVIARRVPGGYRLYGKKAFASMWEASNLAFLYARPEEGTAAQASIGFLAPTSGEGVTVQDVWDTMGMRSTRSQTVVLDGAFVPDDLVLHETDQFIHSFLIGGAAWSFGGYTGVYLGVGTGILNFAREFLSGRIAKGFDQPMGFHPDVRRRIGQMAAELEGARLALWQAGYLHETQGPSPATFLQFVRAKYLVGEAVAGAARHAATACGIHSLFKTHPLERMIRDAATAPIMPPNSDLCLSMLGLMEQGLNPDDAMPPLRPRA